MTDRGNETACRLVLEQLEQMLCEAGLTEDTLAKRVENLIWWYQHRAEEVARLRHERSELLLVVRFALISLSQADSVPPLVLWDVRERLKEVNQRLNPS